MDKMQQAFREVFGRAQRKGDRMLLAGYRYSEQDFKREQRKAFDLAKSPKHLVYATEKTGRFVTNRNRKYLTKDDLVEWDAAVEEYLTAESKGIDLLERTDSRLNRAIETIKKCTDDAVIHLGSYIDRTPKLAGTDLAAFCRHLLLVKCYWHIKCISDRWDDLSTTEVCALTRSLYECTLIIGNLTKNPSFAESLQAQAFGGSAPFPYRIKRNGLPDFSTIVSEESGMEFPARTSFKKCADEIGSSHAEFFDVIYPALSDHVHFDLNQMIQNYRSSGSFLMWDDGDEITVSLLSSVMLIYLFGSILFVPSLQKLVKRDAAFMGQRIADALDELLTSLEGEGLYNEKFVTVLAVLNKVYW